MSKTICNPKTGTCRVIFGKNGEYVEFKAKGGKFDNSKNNDGYSAKRNK